MDKSMEVGTRQQMIMNCIWTRGGQATTRDIMDDLEQLYGDTLSNQGTNTIMDLLLKKGLVRRAGKAGKFHIYEAAVTEEEFQKREMRRFVGLTFHNSAYNLTTALIDSELSEEEIEALRKKIEERRKHGRNVCPEASGEEA